MIYSLLANLKASCVNRVDVNFEIRSQTIDGVIGRKAHILFLESGALLKMLLYCCSELFQ